MAYELYIRDLPANDTAGYFRLNNVAMRDIRMLMRAAGIADEDLELNLNKIDESLSARSSDPLKVPMFKFCSGDGWLVSPEECEVLATALEEGVTTAQFEKEIQTQFGAKALQLTDGQAHLMTLFVEGQEEELKWALSREGLEESFQVAVLFADFCARAAQYGGFEVF